MEEAPGGKRPAGEGWFVVNAREAQWLHNEKFGGGVTFEGNPGFAQLGINIQVMWPGQPNGYYHAEEGQEDFLVLRGECLLIVEGQERPLAQWDFVHCPRDVPHVIVGAGTGPSLVLAVGGRVGPEDLLYPVDPVALAHGAGVETETPLGAEAYARFTPPSETPFREEFLLG
jgi:uncharacterized cupin superfamily protein